MQIKIIYANIKEFIIEIVAVEIGHPHEQQQLEQVLALHKKQKKTTAEYDSKSTSCYQFWRLGYCAFLQHLPLQNMFFQWQALQLPKIGQD